MAQVRDLRENRSGDIESFPLVDVKVGDTVGFKSDYEQRGTVVEIISGGRWGHDQLRLRNESGFGGEYLRYAKETVHPAEDCWIG